MSEKGRLFDELLLKPKQCNIFVNAVATIASVSFAVLVDTKCKQGHSVFHIVARKQFNLFSRNVLRRINECKNQQCLMESSRKVRKLQSKTAK